MEIKKILIANRGEIALRIIRACKEMGIKTVALCPQKGQEEHFLETKLADEFYYLEEEGILGYLDQRKLIEIAKEADVDAIHPGYGFLAENGDFADFCEKNDISSALVTTIDKEARVNFNGLELNFYPVALYAYVIGMNSLEQKRNKSGH